MSTTDFERNDDLDALSSEELEEQAFGPDPNRKRARKSRPRRGRRRKRRTETKPAPPPAALEVVVTKFCYACGSELDARAEVCPHCGVRQPTVPSWAGRTGRGKSKGAATLLALALGGVGAHRFYLGQPKVGAVMLLFCWTFLPALVGVADFFRYVFMSDRRFAELYDKPSASQALLIPPRSSLQLGRASGPREGAFAEQPAANESAEYEEVARRLP